MRETRAKLIHLSAYSVGILNKKHGGVYEIETFKKFYLM